MGEVFLAIDDSLGRRAAIKLLGVKHLGDETVRERFLREARALARLNHPNLITVYESGFLGPEQRPYFAMELLEGGDTEKLMLEQGPLPSGVVALIGAQAAAGLGEAARAQDHPPRRQTGQPGHLRPRRAQGDRLQPGQVPRHRAQPDRQAGSWWAPPTTSPPSRPGASRSTSGPTSTRSAARSTTC